MPPLWQAGVVSSDAPPGATSPTPFDRARALRRMTDETFDVLVIGGGITGAGVALDAAARGLRTALVERHDFASGTSSASSKLVHGGIRYLQQGDVRLVYEALHERQRLLRNAPHLVQLLPFLIPLFGRDGVVGAGVARAYATALWLYDLTGGWRIGRWHRRVDREEVLAHFPTLRTDRLVAGFVYFDAQADDARLTLAVLRTAALDFGAAVANYAEVVSLRRDGDGMTTGATVRRCAPGESGEIQIRARVVVNATGVWSDDVRALDEGTHLRTTRPAKGVHVTVPASRLPADIAAVVPVAGDRRSIFIVPWPDGDDVYVGTTDTAWDGSLDQPECTPDDVAYLVGAVNAVATVPLSSADVTGVWAGLRPLLAPPPSLSATQPATPASPPPPGGTRRPLASLARWRRQPGLSSEPGDRTADLSRRHRVLVSPSGVVTVTGGKLTTYRLMAEETVDVAVRRLGTLAPPGATHCPTRHLALHGAPPASARGKLAAPRKPTGTGPEPADAACTPDVHLDDTVRQALWARHGTETDAVLAPAIGHPELLQPIVPGLPYLRAEVLWAARHEMAVTVDDVLSRRTRATLRDSRAAAAAAGEVADLLAPIIGRPGGSLADDARAYAATIDEQLARAGLAPRAGVPEPSAIGTPEPDATGTPETTTPETTTPETGTFETGTPGTDATGVPETQQ